jgi:glycosyltransferase involved in cell wall biosynthesis
MIKVLAAIVVPPHLSVSGGARAGELLSAALAERCDVTVANMMGGEAGNTHSPTRGIRRIPVRTWLPPLVPWSRFPSKYGTLFYRSELPAIVRNGDFDIVHIHNPMPALEMERVARACLARGLPYVVSTHGFNEVANGGQVYGFDPVRRLAWKTLVEAPVARVVARASGIFALSPADFDIVRNMGFTGAELSVVSNGVAIPEAPARDENAALDRLGIPTRKSPDQITCMFLANHTPNKGLPDLLEAFAGLERPYLLIVGGETRADIDYGSYVNRCRPGQRIIVTGRLTDAEVAAALHRSDLFVFPTLADTFPLVVLEAMAHGLPVLASRVGGIPHQVDERCGVLIEPRDVAALRAAVDRLARDPAHLATMGRHARLHTAMQFTWAKAAGDAAAGY